MSLSFFICKTEKNTIFLVGSLGRSIEASTDSICLDLSSQKALYAAAVSRVMDRHKHRCSHAGKFQTHLNTPLPSSCRRLELGLLRTESRWVGIDRWQRVAGQPGLLFRLEPGLANSWHGAADRFSPVAMGVRKRGKPSQWKLPCGWLRRPRHCIYRALPATRNSSVSS